MDLVLSLIRDFSMNNTNRSLKKGCSLLPWDLLTERTYRAYVTQIESNGTRESLPYRRVVRAVQNYDLFL